MIVLGKQYPYGGAKDLVILGEGEEYDHYLEDGWFIVDSHVICTTPEAWDKYTEEKDGYRVWKCNLRQRPKEAMSKEEIRMRRTRNCREIIRRLCRS